VLKHDNDIDKYDIPLFDIVIVNLYPFETIISNKDVLIETAIENIDIGGVALLRASAKNYKYVWTISSISQYDRLITGLGLVSEGEGDNDKALQIRIKLSCEAFHLISNYDNAIKQYLETNISSEKTHLITANKLLDEQELSDLPDRLYMEYEKVQDMRYGENSH
jgi:phosphoribosylaminoimidazolecarboxamide formyltransferase/IMP cyclohydrolase